MLKKGFFTAIGTPLDDEGCIVISSLKKQIERQIEAGATGVFLYGTMGMGGCIRNSEYEDGIKAAIKAVDKRCVLLVGASDNSLQRVADKMKIVNKYDAIDGVVMTAPYYFKTGEASLVNFFMKTAAMTKKDYYLYDHEPITKHKLTSGIMAKLMKAPNIKGIKSGDLVLIKQLTETAGEDFTPIFSGSDLFDVAHNSGITRYLDGIFACMPASTGLLQKYFDSNDAVGANKQLRKMMGVRDEMIAVGIWPAFSYAMNLLGYEGNFSPDYEMDIGDDAKKIVAAGLKKLGEI